MCGRCRNPIYELWDCHCLYEGDFKKKPYGASGFKQYDTITLPFKQECLPVMQKNKAGIRNQDAGLCFWNGNDIF